LISAFRSAATSQPSSSDSLLLSQPEEEDDDDDDDDDDDPVSSTSEAMSEPDEELLEVPLKLLNIGFEEAVDRVLRWAVESRLAIPRTAEVIAAEIAEGSSSGGVGSCV
jgi:hypothetical protein